MAAPKWLVDAITTAPTSAVICAFVATTRVIRDLDRGPGLAPIPTTVNGWIIAGRHLGVDVGALHEADVSNTDMHNALARELDMRIPVKTP